MFERNFVNTDVELNQKKNGLVTLFYWLAGAGRTTSVVLLEEPIISPRVDHAKFGQLMGPIRFPQPSPIRACLN